MTIYNAEFFRDMRRKRDAGKAQVVADLRPHEITSPGHEVLPEEIMSVNADGSISTRGNFGSVYHRAILNGYDVKCGKSVFYTGDRLQENGKVRLGKDGTLKWMQGMKYMIHAGDHAEYNWFELNEDNARFNGVRMDIKTLKERLSE